MPIVIISNYSLHFERDKIIQAIYPTNNFPKLQLHQSLNFEQNGEREGGKTIIEKLIYLR